MIRRMRELVAAPPGKQWTWRGEPMAIIGVDLLAYAISKSLFFSLAAAGVGFFVLGWRLEKTKGICPACGSLIPENEAADLRRCVYVRRDELDALAKPPPPRPS